MYELMISEAFSAAHRLREYDGRCEELHGHNWRVDVYIQAKGLDGADMALDFRILKERTREVLEELDHTYLNELPQFQSVNPSSECIARYIFERLSNLLDDDNVKVIKVTAWESETACASFIREER